MKKYCSDQDNLSQRANEFVLPVFSYKAGIESPCAFGKNYFELSITGWYGVC